MNKKKMCENCLAIGIVFLFIGVSVIPSVGITITDKQHTETQYIFKSLDKPLNQILKFYDKQENLMINII